MLVGLGELSARLVSAERHRGSIESALAGALGLDVEVAGPIRLSLLPRLHLEAQDVRVSNLPGRSSPLLLRVGEIEISLNLLPFVRSRAWEVRSLQASDVELHVDPDAEGRFQLPPGLAGSVESDRGEMELGIEHLGFEDVNVFYRAPDGERVSHLHVERLELEAEDLDEPLDLELRGHLDGSDFDLEGRLGSIRELFTPTQAYPLNLRGDIFEAKLDLEGSIEVPLELRGVDLRVKGSIPDFGRELRERGQRLPELGAVSFSAHLTSKDDEIGLLDLAFSTTGNGVLSVDVRGEIRKLRSLEGIELDVSLTTSSLEVLEPYIDDPPPAIDLIEIEAHLSDAGGPLGAEGTLNVVTHDGRVEVRLSGAHADLRRAAEVDLGIDATISDLSVLAELLSLEEELPAIGPITASGRLRDRDGALALEDLQVSVGDRDGVWAEATGYVHDVLGPRAMRLESRFGVSSMAEISEYLGRPLPDLGPFVGNIEIADRDGSLGIESLHVEGGRRGTLRIVVDGKFDDLRDLDEISLRAKLDARDLAVLGALAGSDQPAVGPVSFSGRVTGSDRRLVSTGETVIGESHFTGEWSLRVPEGGRPSLNAKLRSAFVRLEDTGLMDPEETTSDADGSDADTPVVPPAWKSRESLPFERLRDLDARVELEVDRVVAANGIDIKDLRVVLRLVDGELTVPDFSGTHETGSLRGGIRIDASGSTPELGLFLDAAAVDLQRLADLMPNNDARAGLASAWINLASSGNSPQELRENLSGTANAMLHEGTLTSGFAQMFVTNMVRVGFPGLMRTSEHTSVGCFRAELEIEEGMATARSLVLEGAQESVVGEGQIDLARGFYDLELTPHTTRPGLISVAARIRMTGPFDDPRFTPVTRTIATSAARGLISNALRPARAMLGMVGVGSRRASVDPCTQPLITASARPPSWVEASANEPYAAAPPPASAPAAQAEDDQKR